jgi:putative tryptophan/tyrosine transport system substrate-binding protein
VDRRAFIGTVAGGLLAAPLAVEAQPAPKVARLGVLLFSTQAAEPNLPALLAGLRDLGYVEGRNIVFEYRGAEGRPERVGGLAHQIVALKPDLIVVLGGDLVPFVKGATSTIPVVMLTPSRQGWAFEAATRARPEALMVASSRFMNLNRSRVLEFVGK